MANYYNINRSIEAYEFRMIDPDDGQLKKLTDIPSLGGGGGGGGYTDTQIDGFLALKADLLNPTFTTNINVGSRINADTINLSSNITASSVIADGMLSPYVYSNSYNSLNLNGNTSFIHNTITYMMYDYSNETFEMKKELHAENGFKSDTLDTLNNTNLSFLRNGSEYMEFQTSPERIVMNKPIGIYGGSSSSVISEGVEGSFNVLRIRNLDTTNPYLILTCSDGVDTNNLTMTKGQVALNTKFACNWYDGISDFDVSFRRNAVEYFKLDGANQIVNVANAIGVSTANIYANNIRNRSDATDTVFYGAHSDGTSPSVEYMRYDHLNAVLNILSGITFSGGVKADILNTATNTAMQIQRNGNTYITLTVDDRITMDRRTDITASGIALSVNDAVDGFIQLGNGQQIDTWTTGGLKQEMQLNYVADDGVRIGNANGYLGINSSQHTDNQLTVGGKSYLGGDVEIVGDISMRNLDRITFGDRHYVREETNGTMKRLKFHSGSNDDYFMFVLGNELIDNSKIFTITKSVSTFKCDVVLQDPYGAFKSNAFDSFNTESVIFSRNGIEQMRFSDTTGNIHMARPLYITGGEGESRIYEATEGSLNAFRIWNNASINTPVVGIGAGADANIMLVYSNLVEARKPIHCNTYNSNGNFDTVFQRNGVEYMKFQTSDIAVNQDIYMNSTKGILTSNITNTLSNDLSLYATLTNNMRFYANAVEKMNITSSAINFLEDVAVSTGKGINVDETFCNVFDSRYTNGDIVFQFNNAPYMYYDYDVITFKILEDCECFKDLDVQGVFNGSDRSIKKDIEDVEVNCSDIVKKY